MVRENGDDRETQAATKGEGCGCPLVFNKLQTYQVTGWTSNLENSGFADNLQGYQKHTRSKATCKSSLTSSSSEKAGKAYTNRNGEGRTFDLCGEVVQGHTHAVGAQDRKGTILHRNALSSIKLLQLLQSLWRGEILTAIIETHCSDVG